MSQHAFCEIVTNIDQLVAKWNPIDIGGNSLSTWDASGVVGWDPGAASYFIQLDTGADEPPVWISSGLPTFRDLCTKIGELFQQPTSTFEFTDVIEKD